MRFGFEVYISDERLGLRLWNWFIRLMYVEHDYNRDLWHSWGIAYSDSALHCRWGKKNKILWMPWDWGANVRHEVQNEKLEFEPSSEVLEGVARRALVKFNGNYRRFLSDLVIKDGRKIYVEPYTYQLKDGTIQDRVATFYVEEREWRWRMFHPYAIGPKKISRSISVNFNDEVGEQTGSWKGGTTGCGYEMLPHETPVEALRRMERERKFK